MKRIDALSKLGVALTFLVPAPAMAMEEPFEEKVLALASRFSESPDRSLELALIAAGCDFIVGGELGPATARRNGQIVELSPSMGRIAFAKCQGNAEVSLRTSIRVTRIENGREFSTSSEVREPGEPDANGLAFVPERQRDGKLKSYLYHWRNQDGVQYQLRYFNATDEKAAKEYLEPIALQIKNGL